MNVLLLAVAGALAVGIALLLRAHRVRSASLRYMHDKLMAIVDAGSSEKLLLITDDPELKRLLAAINRILNHNQQILANYNRTEMAMRKMLANVSHDLKTPLTVVLGYIETIRHDPDMPADERDRLLARVHGKAMEVLELMNKFFDLARLESQDMDIPMTRIDLNEVCRKNMLAFYDLLTARGLDVVIEIPDEPVFVFANEEALDRILNNLLSNAIRYGSDGNVIGLSLRADDKHAFVDVWDRGRGIKEMDRDRVFERMYTLEDSRSKSVQGSGLGLTITKRLVERMGGEIALDSRPHEKTTFTFSLKRLKY